MPLSLVASTSAPSAAARVAGRSAMSGSCPVRPVPCVAAVAAPLRFAAFTTSRKPAQQRSSTVARAAATSLLAPDCYLVLGVAQCFEKGPEGKLQEITVIEPVGASSLECMANGARTSFKHAVGITFKDALAKSKAALPEEFQAARFCDKFEYRCEAAVRTWLRPHAQDNLMDIVPLNKVVSKFNFSLDDKRVLNQENVVTDDDNVKQDISIDVYGRQKKEEVAAALAAETAAASKAQEEEDLEQLLAM